MSPTIAPSGHYNVVTHAGGAWTLLETVDGYGQACERADTHHAASTLFTAVFSSTGRRVHVGGDKPTGAPTRPVPVTYLAGISEDAQRVLRRNRPQRGKHKK